ncbi:MAG: hypothetical protein ACR2QW_09290 [bacterium]
MEKPVCRVCGEKHWSNESHRFRAQPTVERDEGIDVEKPDMAADRTSDELPATTVQRGAVDSSSNADTPAASESERVQRWRSNNRGRYNAYQRDYMRKRRKE